MSEGSVNILKKAKEYNKKIIYIIDDDFENMDPMTKEGQYHLAYNPKKHIPILGRNSDSIWVYNNYLRNKFLLLNPNVKIMPIFSNIEYLSNIKVQPRNKKGIIYIGYASGEHNRENLKMALPGLKRILLNYKNKVCFETFFGADKEYIKNTKILEDINNFNNVTSYDSIKNLCNFNKYLQQLQWDIGIAPLQNTLFDIAKTNNKYREYGMLGIPGIYSNVEAYKYDVNPGVNGLLVNNSEVAWYTALKELILDKNKREYIKTNAYNDIYKKYNKKLVLDSYIKEINELLGDRQNGNTSSKTLL
jgi:glycosyltransferase involved in cell wall biosynthesis